MLKTRASLFRIVLGAYYNLTERTGLECGCWIWQVLNWWHGLFQTQQNKPKEMSIAIPYIILIYGYCLSLKKMFSLCRELEIGEMPKKKLFEPAGMKRLSQNVLQFPTEVPSALQPKFPIVLIFFMVNDPGDLVRFGKTDPFGRDRKKVKEMNKLHNILCRIVWFE